MQYHKGTFVVVPNKEKLRGKDPWIQTLFFWLCSYADENGVCYPSIQTLADDSGMSERTVPRKIKELVGLKLLKKTSRKKQNSKENASNLYQIMLVRGTDSQSLGTDCVSPGVLTHSHQGTDTVAEELYPFNYNQLELKERSLFFSEETLKKLKQKYPKQNIEKEVEKFTSYWTEKSPKGKKEKWQKQTTFDPLLRIHTWLSNREKWDTKKLTDKTSKKYVGKYAR